MLPKAKLLFKCQHGLSSQGWRDPQDGLHLRLQGFWGCTETLTILLLTLCFNSLCICPILKKQTCLFSEITFTGIHL